MSIELTHAVEAAAIDAHTRFAGRVGVPDHTWESIGPMVQNSFRQQVLPTILAALPHIASQAWNQGVAANPVDPLLEIVSPKPVNPYQADVEAQRGF